MTMQDKTAHGAGFSRRARIALFASLALNLLFVGLVVGALGRHQGGGENTAAPRLDQLSSAMVQALERHDRREIGRELRQSLQDQTAAKPSRHAEYQAVIAAFRAKDFDVGVIRAALEAQKHTSDQHQIAAQAIMLEHLAKMSAQDRAAYGERLEEVLENRAKRASKWQRDKAGRHTRD